MRLARVRATFVRASAQGAGRPPTQAGPAPPLQKEQRVFYQPRYKTPTPASPSVRANVWAQAQARRSASGRSTSGSTADDADTLADSAGKGWKVSIHSCSC